MSQFRCSACGVASPRRRPPATCPNTSRCAFEELDPSEPDMGDATTEVRPEKPAELPHAPQAAPLPAKPRAPEIVAVIGGRSWTLRERTLLGRNGDIAQETLRQDVSVARRHCEVAPTDGGGWILTRISETSPTVINGRNLPAGQSAALESGRILLQLGQDTVIELHVPLAEPSAPSSEAGASFTGALEERLKGTR